MNEDVGGSGKTDALLFSFFFRACDDVNLAHLSLEVSVSVF